MRTDVTALEVKPDDGVLQVGKAIQLNLFARNSHGGVDLIPGNMAVWSSTDNGVAEVSRQGRVTPRGGGSVSITAAYGDKKVVAVFTVAA